MQPPAASPGPAAPAGAELLRWQWREVQAPCLVAAWILVASLAKIGECPRVPTRSGPPGTALPVPGQAAGDAASPAGAGAPGTRGVAACRDTGHGDKSGWSSLSAGLRRLGATPHSPCPAVG